MTVCTNKRLKRFQMKSNGCRDVLHTGLQSTQTRRNTGKQGAQTLGHSAHLPKHPYVSGCMVIFAYASSQFKVTKIDNELTASICISAATWRMLGKMCQVPPCLCTLLTIVFLLVCVLCRPVCRTSLHSFDLIWNVFIGLFHIHTR